jgi:hypothetical protein
MSPSFHHLVSASGRASGFRPHQRLPSRSLVLPSRQKPPTASPAPSQPDQIARIQQLDAGVLQTLNRQAQRAIAGADPDRLSADDQAPVPALKPTLAPSSLQRWSEQHETRMVELHQGSLQDAMVAYREAIQTGEPAGADLEAIKQVIREKLSTQIHGLIASNDIDGLNALQTGVEAIGAPDQLLRQMFRHRVRQYLGRKMLTADQQVRADLQTLFEPLDAQNWLRIVFEAYLQVMPIFPADAASQELTELADTLEPGQGDQDRQEAVRTLTTWFREHAIDEEQVRHFLASGHSASYKTQVLGRLAVQFARGEFLLGWAYEGGYDRRGSWEEHGPTQGHPGGAYRNAGEYPTAYQEAVHTWGGEPAYLPPGQRPTSGNYAEWCTSFVGFLSQHLGFAANEDVRAGSRHSMFWSGSRLRHWAQRGTSTGGHVLNQPDNLIVNQASSVLMNRAAFRRLWRQLRRAAAAERVGVVQTFFETEGNGVPQPGDVVLHPSHTMMVESYDANSATIATIEGNRGQAVRSRNIVLSDPQDVANLRTLIRIGAENYQGFGEEIEDAPEVDGEDLVGTITHYVDILADRLQTLGFVNAGAGAATQSWQAGEAEGGVQ